MPGPGTEPARSLFVPLSVLVCGPTLQPNEPGLVLFYVTSLFVCAGRSSPPGRDGAIRRTGKPSLQPAQAREKCGAASVGPPAGDTFTMHPQLPAPSLFARMDACAGGAVPRVAVVKTP